MALELQKGRPADTTGRLDKEIRTYDLLDRLGVEYDRVDHAPAMTMEDCKEVDEILEAMVCKNLFLSANILLSYTENYLKRLRYRQEGESFE